MAKQAYDWFLEPRDSHTNEVISRNVGAENLCDNIVCADGQRRNLWKCPSGMVFVLWRSRSDLEIRLRIFSRYGANGKIRDVTFLFKNESGGGKKKRRRSHEKEKAKTSLR